MSEQVLDLKTASDPRLAGGKAASLAKLLQDGFSVPAGFVITTGAFQQMTKRLEKKIFESFDRLSASAVAVRSSAVAEDGKVDAWAGQMDSFLSVQREQLIESIQKCWASANSDRAKAYAREKGLRSGHLAVIVQAMINGQTSGVAFSVHPVTKNKNHMIIEAVSGLADSLVSGEATPDSYTLEKDTLRVINCTLVGKAQILSDAQIVELAKEIQKLEKFFRFPIDVEWTFSSNKLFILQSRPITTLG